MRQRRSWKNDEEGRSGKSILMTRRSSAGFPVGYGVNSAFSPSHQSESESRFVISSATIHQIQRSDGMLCIR